MYIELPDGTTGQYLWIEFEVFVVLAVKKADFGFVFYGIVRVGGGRKERRTYPALLRRGFCHHCRGSTLRDPD